MTWGAAGAWGSSPLTRGKRHGRPRPRALTGLIPAHAGKTALASPRPWRSWAHPRSRGENAREDAGIPWFKGSSPLTRGKLVDAVTTAVENGLIPAHAGKTPHTVFDACLHTAHPRSRGENSWPAYAMPMMLGSSPLTRGKLEGECHRVCEVRLIPAHAGKTSTSPLPARTVAAHPRSRGENLGELTGLQRRDGSSPLTRGKPMRAKVAAATGGLIPAHAGKTISNAGLRSSSRAHPRSRGENTS